MKIRDLSSPVHPHQVRLAGLVHIHIVLLHLLHLGGAPEVRALTDLRQCRTRRAQFWSAARSRFSAAQRKTVYLPTSAVRVESKCSLFVCVTRSLRLERGMRRDLSLRNRPESTCAPDTLERALSLQSSPFLFPGEPPCLSADLAAGEAPARAAGVVVDHVAPARVLDHHAALRAGPEARRREQAPLRLLRLRKGRRFLAELFNTACCA